MSNIVLIGFSYTGKSTVARLVARQLEWQPVDTDDVVVAKAGKSLAEIFAEDGESKFRAMEKAAVKQAASHSNQVISTGGGAILDPENRDLLRKAGVVICLDASAETIHERLKASEQHSPTKNPRPLLAGADPLESIRRLKAERQALYSNAQATIATDGLTSQRVAEEVIRLYRSLSGHADVAGNSPAFVVTTETQSYPGYVDWGILETVGARMKEAGLSGRAFILADRNVYALHGKRLESALTAAGFSPTVYLLEPGEQTKDMASATQIYAWLANERAERKDIIVSFGGGMATDLAGFIAATYLRGMPLVHVPTSLLGMVDAAVGGKVAVNLPVGKNLVGAFYQPAMVLADTQMLATLPPRELTSGWAELIKHALIMDAGLFSFIDENQDSLLSLDPALTTEAVRRSTAIKADVVSRDEKETTGLRILLNYGHTVGHALEAATGYEQLLHGEAVAIGMMAAGRISVGTGRLSAEALTEQARLLSAFGLPLTAPSVDMAEVRAAMSLDKKVTGKAIRWVLLEDIGRSTTDANVPAALVDEALRSVVRS